MMDIFMILTIIASVASVFLLLYWCTEQVDGDE